MNNGVEVSSREPFAKGQKSRDLQVWYDAGDVEAQFVDAIDSAYDFIRLIRLPIRGIASKSLEVF
jgi:hypothetical protein